MKTHAALILITAICQLTRPALAQSTFAFRNFLGFGSSVDAPVFDAAGNRLSGTNYVALLYGGQTMNSLAPAINFGSGTVMPVPLTLVVAGLGGYLDGGTVQVDTLPCGGLAWLQVRAWDARLGATYGDVVKLGLGGYGESNLFQDPGGNPCYPITPPGFLLGLQSFSLLPEVPEPGSLSLLVFGSAALLFLRRGARR